MSVAKWTTPSNRSSNLAGTTLDGKATGTECGPISYDNSTNKDLYASVTVKLGTITTTGVPSVTLRVYTGDGTDVPDIQTGSSPIGASDTYTAAVLTTAATAKVVVFPMVRLYPMSNMRFTLQNNTNVTTAATGNEFYVRPYNEDIV
jgi:hypothetical protein